MSELQLNELSDQQKERLKKTHPKDNKLNEINSLITLRNFTDTARNSFDIKREQIKYYDDLLILLDEKIYSVLHSQEFEKYIEIEKLTQLKQDKINSNNLKSKQNHPNQTPHNPLPKSIDMTPLNSNLKTTI